LSQLQDAVTQAVETSTAFSDETLKEHANFELTKKEEMKELLGEFADAQIMMYKSAMEDWDKVRRLLSSLCNASQHPLLHFRLPLSLID
jgi:sorting nexin-4